MIFHIGSLHKAINQYLLFMRFINNKNHIAEAREEIEIITERLKEENNSDQTILFGSFASGNPAEESDIDLLIIKDTEEPFLARWMTVRGLVSDLRKGVAFSPIAPSELETRLGKEDPFFKEILQKGKKLYA